ncbi:MAG: exodeoxyribonuclease V subunit gamma [Lysobacter sp.]
MPARPDFRLYHSNALDVLAGLLAEELRRPVPGQPLLAPDVVLIPQVAMRRWLQATLAQAHGIAANLEFLTPGEFVQRALDANVPGKGEDLDADGLRWRLYAALSDPTLLREPALRPLRAYLHGIGSQSQPDGDDALKPWSLAGELASVFEKYQAWRRDWLLGWEGGQGRLDPQAALWRRIASGRRHRARRIDDYLARFGDGAAPPAGLPPRLFAFATLNVSPDVLRVIASQAHVGTLHFYLPTPTRKYWGDLHTLAERLRDGEAVAFGGDDAGDNDENPLLQAWGAAGRDFMAVMGGYEVVHPSADIAAYADPEEESGDLTRDTLLQRLQRDLLHRRAPPATPWRAAIDRGDNSLQVHACHTRLREVQVLHDQLRGLLEDKRFDPPLQPREIAVLAPDIDPYAPYIAAVFGGLAGRPDFIPYALADTSPLASEPLAEVFLRLLSLPISRFGLHEVLELLATPAIAEQAGLDAPALDRLRHWLHAAGARWGLDAAHRARSDAPRDDAYTWAFALDRLLLGHASGDDADIAGVAPWPDLEGGALDALDALIRLLRVLARHERALDNAMTPRQWRDRLLGLLDALLPAKPRRIADQRTLERLRTLLDGFANAAERAAFDAPVPPEVIRAHCQAALTEADTRAPLLTGGVSFGRMVPMRLLPFRAICILGMNDGDYPRRDPAGGLNKLTAELGSSARRPGDRSLRDDDRFLFLQLFAAASDVFYLSYLGADPRDGGLREPSLLASELLDVVGQYHADASDTRDALVVRHPLQPFAPAAFGAQDEGSVDADAHTLLEPRRFSYRSEWRPAAAAGGERRPIGPWLASPLPAAETEDALSLVDLRAFLRDPPAAFLRQRLALRLPADADDVDDVEPLVLPGRGLQRQHLQQAVFDALVRDEHDQNETAEALSRGELDALHDRLRARALLPSGALGQHQLERLLAEVRPYASAFARWRSGEAEQRAFELDVDGVRLHGRIDQLYPSGLARFRFEDLHGPSQVAHGLDWLVLSALGDARPLAQFAQTSTGPGPHLREPIASAQARAALRTLITLRAWGLRDPLPFLARAGWHWYEAKAEGKNGWPKAEAQWRGSARSWGEAGTASARLALRGRDPFDDDALGEEFRRIADIVFDAVVHGRIEDAA